MHTFENTLRIILPHLRWYQRILRINLEAVVAYSTKQFCSCKDKRDGVNVTKYLSVLRTLNH